MLTKDWRPRRFSDIKGQTFIDTLKGIANNKFTQTWLFTGAYGCGKTTTAKILAMLLNCTHKTADGEPCLECESCRSALNETNLNIIEIDAANKSRVADMREVIDSLKYKTDGVKVYIFDEVHRLTPEAADTALKTFEEPPGNCIFILCTNEPQKLPNTVLSRCQRFDFKRIKSQVIYERLLEICIAEKIGYEEGALKLLARLANGAMRDGVKLLDQYSSTGRVEENEIRRCMGLGVDENVMALAENLMKKDRESAIITIGRVFDDGQSIPEFTSRFSGLLREIWRYKTYNQISDIFSEAEKAFITSNEEQFTKYELERYMEDLVTVESDLQSKTKNPQIVLELFALKAIPSLGIALSEALEAKKHICSVLSGRIRDAAWELENASMLIKDNVIIITGISEKNRIPITKGFVKTLNRPIETVYV